MTTCTTVTMATNKRTSPDWLVQSKDDRKVRMPNGFHKWSFKQEKIELHCTSALSYLLNIYQAAHFPAFNIYLTFIWQFSHFSLISILSFTLTPPLTLLHSLPDGWHCNHHIVIHIIHNLHKLSTRSTIHSFVQRRTELRRRSFRE